MNGEGRMDLAGLDVIYCDVMCELFPTTNQSILIVHLFWGSLLKAMTVTGLVR